MKLLDECVESIAGWVIDGVEAFVNVCGLVLEGALETLCPAAAEHRARVLAAFDEQCEREKEELVRFFSERGAADPDSAAPSAGVVSDGSLATAPTPARPRDDFTCRAPGPFSCQMCPGHCSYSE